MTNYEVHIRPDILTVSGQYFIFALALGAKMTVSNRKHIVGM